METRLFHDEYSLQKNSFYFKISIFPLVDKIKGRAPTNRNTPWRDKREAIQKSIGLIAQLIHRSFFQIRSVIRPSKKRSSPLRNRQRGRAKLASLKLTCPPVSRLLFLRLVGLLQVTLLGKTSLWNKHLFHRLVIFFEWLLKECSSIGIA